MITFKEFMIEKYTKESEDIEEVIGYLKGKYNTISQVKQCPRFKKLSEADKEYVIDELKADGFK